MAQGVDGQPPRPPGFVRLPASVRRRVYLYLGVARFDGRPYTYYLDGRKESPRNFAGVLLSCRALHTETAALLYSANRFIIFYSRQGSLEPLRALSPTTLASLTSLKIVLNESSCHHPTDSSESPSDCCYDASYNHGPWRDGEFGRVSEHCAKHHGYLHRLPLLDPASQVGLDSMSANLAAQAMLSEWYDTAAYLSSCVSVERLALSLVCDVDPGHSYALEVARLAVAPIADLFPHLKDGHIRLCKTPNRPLQRLAEEAVFNACRPGTFGLCLGTAKTSSALFTNLPPELRVRILEYTDLITPWKEVTWSRQDRGYQVCRPPWYLDHEPVCPRHIHHGTALSYCGPRGARSGPGCFCRRRHAAFSLTSCQCWAPPTDLFLICRVLRRDAEFVFFSGNRFVVHDYHAMPPWKLPDVQQERFGASVFLREIVPAHCLAYLRFLELVFPPYAPHDWPQDDEHAAIQDWRATLDWIRARINAPALTIRIVMADSHLEIPEGRRDVTKDQVNDMLGGYARIAHPLGPLVRDDGLAGFYAQLALPWRWTRDTVRSARQCGPWGPWWLAREERRLNEDCERRVRGGRDDDATVDSRDSSKAEPRKSVWQRWYEVEDY
ncbi:hypothetical protein C8A00DRAFT_46855 [Chaetomidium leptoderma]|uniref:F-box domain-containing protein n=1 Tax=Chaetomidium leptoderma TaxID=669021 RepID=A0AAN6ZTI9_9PEZI|nr:hypothetical protein C8A00DRAFT_46855 [Chaetomidium leptoderma]